ncbi:Nn.00g084370.m01.CDS01 [Neocucurbitaria sp. VM-36]
MAGLPKSVDNFRPNNSGDKPNTMTPNTTPWVVEPPSKTAICTITYPLPEIPHIYAIPIEVTSGDGASPSPVLSQRLRKEAIDEFVRTNLTDITEHHAVQFWVHKQDENGTVKPLDHILVIPRGKDSELSDCVDSFIKQKSKMRVSKQTRAATGKIEHLPIFCRIRSLEKITADCNRKEYWQKLNLLIQQKLRDINLDSTFSNSGAEGLLFDALPEISVSPSGTSSFYRSLARLESNLTAKNADKITGLLRMKIKVDPYLRNTDEKEKNDAKVHLELDIAPVIRKGTRLSDVLLDVFGRRILGSTIGQDFHDVKGMLLGLKVNRTYGTSTTASGINTTGAISGLSFDHGKQAHPSPPRPQSRSTGTRLADTPKSAENGSEFTVQDVKLAGDISAFLKNNEKFSVVSYFKKEHGINLQYPTLPLARITRNAWVPLELLISARAQGISASGIMTRSLQKIRDNYDLNKDYASITRIADTINEAVFKSKKEKLNETSHKPSSLEKDGAKPKVVQFKPSPISMQFKPGIIYVAPKDIKSNSFLDYATFVDTKLRDYCGWVQQGAKTTETMSTASHADQVQLPIHGDRPFNIPSHFEPLVTVLPDVKPLLLVDSRSNATLQQFHTKEPSRPNTIIAIIDTHGRTNSEIQHIQAELHKFGERKIGAVTYCTTRSTLQESIARNEAITKEKGIKNGFPQGVLERLHVMHGGQMYASSPWNSVSDAVPQLGQDQNVMIFGAHIAHPDAQGAEHCPSVAAVVASIDADQAQFHGEVRLQPTSAKPIRKNNRLKHPVQAEILGLAEMVDKRLRAWNPERMEGAPKVIFFRHSIDLSERQIFHNEMKTIASKIKEVFFEKTVSLTYIVVNKAAKSTPHGESSDLKWFTTEEGSKYRCYIIEGPVKQNIKTLNCSNKDFAHLTRNLNNSYQLGKNAKVDIALPVHYAQKLARRTFDYFHFAQSNRYDTMPGLLRALPHADEDAHKDDEDMTRLIKEYLHIQEARNVPEMQRFEIEQTNPWSKELNEKMFYL